MRCPRCSAAIGPEQDWCLECGAPARTRLAPTPNWRVPTMAIAAVVLLAGALLAFAFVKLTGDDNAPAGTTPTAAVETTAPAVVPPPVSTIPTVPTTTGVPPPVVPGATSTAPAQPTPTPTTPQFTGTVTTPPAQVVPTSTTPGQTTTTTP
jgi:hypothetical protein